MAVYLLAPDSATRAVEAIKDKIKTLVPDLLEITSLEQVAAELGRPREQKTVVIFISPVLPKSGFDNLVSLAARYRDQIFFILVSNEVSGSDYKTLVRSGGADWVPAGGALQEIPELLTRQKKIGAAAVPAQNETARAMVASFVPALGGVGNTSIALETALQIGRAKRTKSWRICYFDLDFQTSHVCDLLDTEPRLQIGEIVEHPERLDDHLFELFINHHSSGLDVLAAPKSRTDLCQISVAVLDVLLDRTVKRYDLVVLDLPVFWFSWTAPILQNSDTIFVTALNSVPCLRQLRLTLDEVVQAKSSTAQLSVVINRAEGGLFGGTKRRQHVERVVNDQKVFYVHEDPQATVRADRGLPAALGGPSRVRKDFYALAEFCSTARVNPRKG
jgi:pilus assembly protein CpaE